MTYIYIYILYDIFNLRNFRSLTEGSSLRQTKKIKHNREMISKVCPCMKLTAVFFIYSLRKIFEQTKLWFLKNVQSFSCSQVLQILKSQG